MTKASWLQRVVTHSQLSYGVSCVHTKISVLTIMTHSKPPLFVAKFLVFIPDFILFHFNCMYSIVLNIDSSNIFSSLLLCLQVVNKTHDHMTKASWTHYSTESLQTSSSPSYRVWCCFSCVHTKIVLHLTRCFLSISSSNWNLGVAFLVFIPRACFISLGASLVSRHPIGTLVLRFLCSDQYHASSHSVHNDSHSKCMYLLFIYNIPPSESIS